MKKTEEIVIASARNILLPALLGYVIGMLLVIGANTIAKKASDTSLY